jgi:hypothetical protein
VKHDQRERPRPLRNKAGQFLLGHKSIGGRKRGSRNLWIKSGKAVLEAVAQQEPAVFLKVTAASCPGSSTSTPQ